MADEPERIHRIGLGDPRGPGEKLSAMIGRAFSKDKHQNRQWDDSPEKRAANRRETEKRIADEKAMEDYKRASKK